jgi:hypothetical protein
MVPSQIDPACVRIGREIIVAFILLFALAPVAAGQSHAIAVAYVAKDNVYTCAFESGIGPKQQWGMGTQEWVKTQRWNLEGRKSGSYRLEMLAYRDVDTPLRWHIAHDCLWVMGQAVNSRATPPGLRVSLSELPLFDSENPRASVANKLDTYWGAFPTAYLDGFVPPKEVELTFDILPTSKESCLLFYQYKSEIRMYEGKGGSLEYKEMDRFQVGFQEWFRVFGTRDAVIFVTHSGKVYLAKRGGEKTIVRELWNDPIRPVVAAVVDVASNTTFLLAQAVPQARSKWIRLDKDGRLTEKFIDPARLKRLQADKPLEACVPFAQYLFAEGLILETKP